MPVISFAERPEFTHDPVGKLIIHAQQHATGRSASFTVDDGLEPVAALNLEGWIDRTNIAVVDILWNRDEAGVECRRAIFQPNAAWTQDKAVRISIRARAGQDSHTAEPLSRARVGHEIVDCARHWRSLDLDIHPEWAIGSGSGAEEFAYFVADEPITAIITFDEWRDEVHRQVNRLTWRDVDRQWHITLPSHAVAIDKDEAVIPGPCTGAVIPQTPDFGEL